MIERHRAALLEAIPVEGERLLALIRPTIRMTPRKARAADRRPGASRLGGDPELPVGARWPEGRHGPIDFVGQLDLAALASFDAARALPRDGLLSFFCGWNEEGAWDHAVVHSPPGARETLARTGARRRPPPLRGLDLAADAVLAPWSSRFVASAERRPQHDPLTGACDLTFDPVVELSPAAHETYVEIHERWREETGAGAHGLLGYDRPMECAQAPGEIMLLRLDDDGTTGHDFIEACTLYFLITPEALADRDFGAVRAVYGASI